MISPQASPPSSAARPAPAWVAALPLGVTAVLTLLLGTIGYVGVGFGVLTSCTNAHSCTETTCGPCRPAQDWLAAGAVGQAVLLVIAVALLVLAGRRPGIRRRVAVVGWALAVVAVAWVVVSSALAGSSS